MAPETTKGIMKLTGNVVGTSIILGICLGHGGFGAVYCGFDTAKGEACAVKAIIRSSRKQLAVKLEREQRVHSLLSSDPSVVSLRAVHEDATYRYFVMDLCLGGNLRSSRLLNEEHPLDPRVFRKKRDLLLQILDVVHRCHSKFIFHRDIKPENILLDENEERIYLADFGLASENAGSEDTKEGTTEYMSPECFGEFSPRVPFLNAPTDVWALGVLLHRMMFNALPWTEASIDCPEFRDFLCDRSGYFLRCWDISKEAHQLLISVFEIIPEKRITIPEFCTRLASIQHFFVPLKQAKELRLVVLNDIDLAWTMSQRAQTVQNYIRFQRGRAYVPLVLPTRPPIETILSSSTMTTIRLVPPPNLPSTDSIATPPLSPNPLDESSSSSSPDSIPLTPQTRSRTKPEDVGVVHDPDLVECMNALDLELEERNPRGRPSVIHIKEATAIREQAKVIVGRTKKEGEVKTCGKRLRIFSGFARALKVHHRVARD